MGLVAWLLYQLVQGDSEVQELWSVGMWVSKQKDKLRDSKA